MFKQNLVKWAKATAIRTVKTFAESLLGTILVGMSISDIQWKYSFSVAAVASFICVLTCIKGLPECEEG